MNQLQVLGRRSSFNVQKVLWTLDHLELGHEHIELGGEFGGLDSREFRGLNPHGKVPVLTDGELVIWESHTILRYLAAQYGTRTLWRDDPAERTYMARWLDWAATRLQPDFMDLFWGYYRAPETERDERAIERARLACAHDYGLLNQQLRTQDFLAGNQFTLADIPAGTTLYRYYGMGLDVPRPAQVVAWNKRLCEMPDYRRQIMIPFDELYGRATY